MIAALIGPWEALAIGLLIVLIYETRVVWVGRRSPHRVARDMHARMRAEWVRALAEKPGFEIVAVQTLRNSLMSATITASTAALCLMGAVSLGGTTLAAGLSGVHRAGDLSPAELLELLLMVALFASFVCATLSMRYYNHVGFAMSLPAGTPQRLQMVGMAVGYIERAGYLYGWSLRCFLTVAPLVVGIISPLMLPLACLALIFVLWQFDRPGAVD